MDTEDLLQVSTNQLPFQLEELLQIAEILPKVKEKGFCFCFVFLVEEHMS